MLAEMQALPAATFLSPPPRSLNNLTACSSSTASASSTTIVVLSSIPRMASSGLSSQTSALTPG